MQNCLFSEPGSVQEMGHCSLVLFLRTWALPPPTSPWFRWLCWMQPGCNAGPGTRAYSQTVLGLRLWNSGLDRLDAPDVTATSMLSLCCWWEEEVCQLLNGCEALPGTHGW